jgi:hypothetical protein
MVIRRKRARTTGIPPSANGASSFHLWWEDVPPSDEVSVVLEVLTPPVVPRLYFWALQVSFVDRGRHLGAAHLGLQWHPGHPGATAVNWGGYDARTGAELRGTTSPLPSATGNANTRDLAWRPATPYRLRITADGAGSVTDLSTGATTVVRRLDVDAPALTLVSPVVWSEVFARCDDPSVTVRWSDLRPAPSRVRPTYQSPADGGCANTLSRPDGDGWLQITSTPRT